MKLLITSLIFVLSGCAQLKNPQVQPVVVKDVNQQIKEKVIEKKIAVTKVEEKVIEKEINDINKQKEGI